MHATTSENTSISVHLRPGVSHTTLVQPAMYLAAWVKSRRCLIEQQDGRRLDEGPGDRQPLPLPATQGLPTF